MYCFYSSKILRLEIRWSFHPGYEYCQVFALSGTPNHTQEREQRERHISLPLVLSTARQFFCLSSHVCVSGRCLAFGICARCLNQNAINNVILTIFCYLCPVINYIFFYYFHTHTYTSCDVYGANEMPTKRDGQIPLNPHATLVCVCVWWVRVKVCEHQLR